ncbi:MAG: VOC family protein [candidate division KSB1 bacterium]|nr:VOC family protein [candidate division KSB1 bacterium]
MAAPVVHFEVMGKDAKKLQSFYSKLFDWQLQMYEPMNYGVVFAAGNGNEVGKGSIGGGIGATQEGQPGYVTFYVQVPDLKATLKQAESMGGKTVVPPTEIPNMVTFAMFSDPEGNMVGLVKG